MELWIQIIFALLAVLGVFATLMPTMPGIPYMFGLSIVYGFIDKFQTFTWRHIAILGIILIVSILVDYFAGVLGAKYGGASRKSLWVGLICLILGTLLAPPFGGFLGLFLGILLMETFQMRYYIKAFRAASFSLAGALLGVVINFSLAVLFYILFLVFMF